MNSKDGLVKLVEVVKEGIRHEDYNRVTELAEKYYQMVTGDDIDDLLEKIITRESEEEFEQRKNISKSVIPPILNSTKLPFQKATRKQPIVRKIDFEGDSEKKKLELEEYINHYWGDKSLEKYLEYAFVDYNFIDPNAFLITEFDPFDANIEKAKPYPFIVTSEQAIMFEYKNEILQYIIVMFPITYMDGETKREGVKFTMYLGLETIVLTQIAQSTQPEGEKLAIKDKFYDLLYYEPKNDKVPAARFGFIRDAETQGRTFVSVFHNVMNYLEKTLKIDSELDLSTAMVAFPQRLAYVSKCQEPGCYKGQLHDGTECPVCHGTGKQPFHRGTMDVITLELPSTPQEMVDLDQILVYKSPPIDLLTFQKEYIEYLKKSVHAMMFNADLFTRTEVSVTATEKVLETDNMNDTLYPFARNYSAIWEFIVRDIATFTDLSEGLTVQHKFPNDFKFKTLSELMGELSDAKNASASPSTIAAIEDDINEILYSDRPDELKQIRIKNSINPFRGYSETNIRFIISQGNTTTYNRTLWENMESIFQDLEVENTDPWLYDMAYDKIIQLVRAKTDEYIQRIADEKANDAKQEAQTYSLFNQQ